MASYKRRKPGRPRKVGRPKSKRSSKKYSRRSSKRSYKKRSKRSSKRSYKKRKSSRSRKGSKKRKSRKGSKKRKSSKRGKSRKGSKKRKSSKRKSSKKKKSGKRYGCSTLKTSESCSAKMGKDKKRSCRWSYKKKKCGVLPAKYRNRATRFYNKLKIGYGRKVGKGVGLGSIGTRHKLGVAAYKPFGDRHKGKIAYRGSGRSEWANLPVPGEAGWAGEEKNPFL